MLMAQEWVTLVHHIKGPGGDRYTCFACRASWHVQNRAAVTTGGLQSARLIRCRVPTGALEADGLEALAALTPGDKIVRGVISVTDGREFAALARKAESAAVLDIHDNTRGVSPHYYIEGAG
ncbi:MAG: DUF6751 family protein [Candidatus Onthomonas sp.]